MHCCGNREVEKQSEHILEEVSRGCANIGCVIVELNEVQNQVGVG